MTCSLNSNSQSSLMFCTVSCDSSRKDLTSLRNIFSEFCYILVIDLIVFFTAEYTVSSARTPGSATGSGLGLAIVKTITERHGGTVSCENAPGAGSIFSVTLPAKFLQS